MKINYCFSLRKFSPRKCAILVLLLGSLLSFSVSSAQQQVSAYTMTQFSGVYTSIAGDGVSSTLNTLQNGFPQDDDGTAIDGSGGAINTLDLPFDFTYDGTLFPAGSTMMLATNGFLVVGTNTGNSVPDQTNWGVADNVNNCILPFSGDLVLDDNGCSGNTYGAYYEVQGTAPHRIAVYEWQDFIIFSNDCFNSGGMQVKIYEGSNVIEFLYANPGYDFGGVSLGDLGTFSDPCVFSVGLNGNPVATDNNLYSTSLSSLPPSDLRFTPPLILNMQLTVHPKTLDFGSIQTGTVSSPLCTMVQNAGTSGTLTIANATITGSSDFTITSIPATNNYNVGDPAGNYCVTFSPSQGGLQTATLTITSNGKDSGTQSVNLTGSGTFADYTIDSLIRFKKTRTALGDSLTQYLHITSTGQVPLSFSNFNIHGQDAGQYFVSYTPVNPLPPGQSDSIGITYVPTLEGRHTATLTIVSNSFSHPSLDVQLIGTGILPHIVVTPPILLFDSTKEGDTVCKTISIWNPGSDTLILSSNILSSNDGDFHYSGLNSENSIIPPDQTRTVTVCFIPLQQGERQARLFLKTNIIKTFDTPRQDTAGTVIIDIQGTGVPFGVFANSVSGSPFVDSALIGSTVCRTDTLKNNGDADILVSGLSITGSQFSFSGLPQFPFLLHARSSKTFTICGTPDNQGLLTGIGVVTGTTGGSQISLGLPLAIFGEKACIAAIPSELFNGVLLPNNGSDSIECVQIVNCGDIPAVYHATVNGTAKADYTVTPAVSQTIASKDTARFCITYKPSAIGVSTATLNVATSDGSESVSVPLAGADGCASVGAIPAPNVPNTGVGGTSTFTATINNAGSYPLTLGTGVITPPGVFTIVGTPVPDPIPVGGSSTVTLTFSPTVLGNVSAALTFPNSGPCQDAAINVTLNGEGIVNSVEQTISEGFSLDQSYPNPTQGNTSFTYTTPRETEISITVVDLTGKLIRTLVTGRVSEGPHTVNFDVRDLPSGTYIYLLESGSTRLVRQLILTK